MPPHETHSSATHLRTPQSPTRTTLRLALLLPCLALFSAMLPARMLSQDAAQAMRQRAHRAAEEPVAAARRARRFVQSRRSATADLPAEGLLAARAQHLAMAATQTASLATAWQPVGPLQVQSQSYGIVTGRVTSLALDPNDASNNTLYLGTTGGGVWKSTNAASASVSFTPLTDRLSAFSPNAGTSVIPSLSIGAITVQPGGTGVVLAGTGDPNDAADSLYGEGVLRSADNGQTWSLVQTAGSFSFTGEGIAGFAWNATSPNVVVMAVSSAAEAADVGASHSPTVRGLYYSTNAGQSWTLATVQDGSTILQNRATGYQTFRGNAATSVVWNPVRKKFYAAIRAHGYYESPDGATWTRMASQPGAGLTVTNCPSRPGDYGLLSCPIVRGTLAVQPNSGDLFAVTVDTGNASQGLWQDLCSRSGNACASGTVTWGTTIDLSAAEDNGNLDAGDYNLTLAAVPAATALSTTDTLLFLGTADLYRCSLAGGCLLRNTTNATTGCAAPAGVAPAQHAVAWGPNLSDTAAPTMFFGNDGGLWRSLDGVRQQAGVCSTDDATHFDNLNGALGSLAEVNSLASDPTDPNVLLAALGANGSAASTSAAQASATAPWMQMSAAESGTVAIDQGSGSNWMLQSGGGVALQFCTSGKFCTPADFSGAPAIGAAEVGGDASLADPPALLDPALNTNALVGTCRVWRGPVSGGSAWSGSNAISSALGGQGACSSSAPSIRSLAAGGPPQFSTGSQNSGSSVLYAGLSGSADGGGFVAGHLYSTSAGGVADASTAWADLTASPVTNDTSGFNAAGFDVSGIAVDRSDSTGRTVYATIHGFGTPHVYRSTNGGATWLNISANLPNAPANAVAVDPGNPHVVYVALDTGVYVTQDVTACVAAATNTTGACWSVYGTALPNAPVTALVASSGFAIPGSAQTGVLRAGTYGRGIWQIPLWTAGETASPVATFSPASLTFGAQAAGSTSAPQTLTLTNTGTAAMAITGSTASSGFAETDTCSGTSLNVGAACTLTVSFAPATAGPLSGAIELVANLPGGETSLPLSGTGTGVPRIVLSPASIAFGDTVVGRISAVQAVTVGNAGNAAATVQATSVSADYSIASNTCGATLAAGATCSIGVAYAPSAAGPNNGSITVQDTSGTHAVALSGNGVGIPNVIYSATSLTFHDGPLNSVAGSATLTLANSGTAAATLGAPVLIGDFLLHGTTCGTTLEISSSCTLTLYFLPTGTGTRTGTLTLTDNAGPHGIALNGFGDAAAAYSISPSQITFPTTEVNSISRAQTVTIADTGGTILFFGIPQVQGDFGVQTTTCANQLNPNRSCQLTIVFNPTADGPLSGLVSLTAPQAGAVPYTILLSGTGHGTARSTVAPSALTFGNVGVGSLSDPQTVTLSNPGTAALALQPPSITGDFRIAASTCGTALAAGGSCIVSITFAPTTGGIRNGVLTLTDALGSHTVSLGGTGAGSAVIALSSAAIDFGNVPLGQNSSRTVTVTNSGNASIGLLSTLAGGDFHVAASTCGSSLAAGATCTVTVVFNPSVNGTESNTFVLTDTASTHTANLIGNGQGSASVAFAPPTLLFGNTAVGGDSSPLTATLVNSGSAPAILQAPTTGGDFRLVQNGCGTSLAAGATCTVRVDFEPTAAGQRSGVLMLADATGTHSVSLQGTGTAGVLTAAPTAIDFPDATLNTATVTRTVTLTNSGNAPLTLGTVTVTGDFAVTGNCNGIVLAGSATCTLSVTFSPTAAGARSGTILVPSNSGGKTTGTTAVALSGNGKSAFNLTLLPTAVDFGAVLVGSSSGVTNVTLSDTGTAGGALGTIRISGSDFSLKANTCGTSLPSQTGCTLSVVFAPTATGTRSGTLLVLSDAGTQTVPLTGVGSAPATDALSPLSLTFGQQVEGTTSAAQTVTLSNKGDVPLTLVSAQILSGDFSATNACGPTLPAHSACSIAVTFIPHGIGAESGVLQVSDVLHAQTVTLRGTAIAGPGVSLAPASLAFANTGVGGIAAGQTLTLTDNGGVPLQIAGVTVTGDFGIVAGSSTCSTSAPVPVGGSCSMSLAFLPQAPGARTGTVTVTSNAATQTAQLSGNGIDFTLVPDGSNTATVSSGGSAAFPLLLRPSQSTSDPVTFACTGAPANARCNVTSQYSDLSATGTVSVTVLTGTTSADVVRMAAWLPLLAVLPLTLRRRHIRGLACVLLLCALFAAQGCGSTKFIPVSGTGDGGGASGSAPTPTGTYTVTVSATAAGVTHSVPLTLKVQ